MTVRRLAATLGALALAYALAGPSPIDPVAWTPPPPPTGLPPFEALSPVERLELDGGAGPESLAFGPDGLLYAGLSDGRIVRLRPDGGGLETFADTGGRPNGLAFDAGGDLLALDSFRGLLRIDPEGRVTTLARGADGEPFGFPDDLALATDGAAWFSDGSRRFPDGEGTLDALEGRATGRLLRYDPATGEVHTRLDGLRFANGVALGPGDAFVLVNESLAYRTLRLWLEGPRAGEVEVFVANYPGFPDNVRSDGRDGFWVALFRERSALLDRLSPHPFAKRIASRFGWLLPAVDSRALASGGRVVRLDRDGRIERVLHDPARRYRATTTALEHRGRLYLGSVVMDAIGRVPLPAR